MKKFTILCFLLLFLLGCSEEESNPVDTAITKACWKCDMKKSEMVWLRDLIESSQQNPSYKGDFYAIKQNTNSTIIIHQPLIMSCIACTQYDCYGAKLPTENRLILPFSELNSKNRIYKLQRD